MIDQVSTVAHNPNEALAITSRWVTSIEQIAILLMFLSPNTLQGNAILVGSFFALLWLNRRNIRLQKGLGAIVFLCVFLLSLMGAVFYFQQVSFALQVEDILKSTSVLIFFLFFPIISSHDLLSKQLVTAMLVLLLISQVILLFNLHPLSDFIEWIYYSEASIRVRTLTSYAGQIPRTGGFLGNPNQAAKFLNLLLILHLVATARSSNHSRPGLQSLIFGVCYIAAIFLTGSRTGFIVSVVTIYIAILTSFGTSAVVMYRRFAIATLVTLVFVLLISWAYFLGSDLRIFQIGEGVTGSFSTKVRLFLIYFGTEKLHLFSSMVGNFFSETAPMRYPIVFADVTFNLDSDLGYFIYTFGLMGLVALALKLFSLRGSVPIVFVSLFLWFFSGSFFFHFKFLLFVMATTMFAFGDYKSTAISRGLGHNAVASSFQQRHPPTYRRNLRLSRRSASLQYYRSMRRA